MGVRTIFYTPRAGFYKFGDWRQSSQTRLGKIAAGFGGRNAPRGMARLHAATSSDNSDRLARIQVVRGYRLDAEFVRALAQLCPCPETDRFGRPPRSRRQFRRLSLSRKSRPRRPPAPVRETAWRGSGGRFRPLLGHPAGRWRALGIPRRRRPRVAERNDMSSARMRAARPRIRRICPLRSIPRGQRRNVLSQLWRSLTGFSALPSLVRIPPPQRGQAVSLSSVTVLTWAGMNLNSFHGRGLLFGIVFVVPNVSRISRPFLRPPFMKRLLLGG